MAQTPMTAIPVSTRKALLAIAVSLPFAAYAVIARQLILGDFVLTTAVFCLFAFACFYLAFLHPKAQQVGFVISCAAIGGLIALRLFGIGTQLTLASGETNIWALFLVTVLFMCPLTWGVKTHGAQVFVQSDDKLPLRFSFFTVIYCVVLIAVAIVQSRANISGTNFQNDEFYHVEVAQGYLHTGRPVLWDFMREQPQVDDQEQTLTYSRAWPYTWQVIQSVKAFGFSESAARLPSAVWFVLSMMLIFFLLRAWMRDELQAFLIVLALVTFDHLVMHARIVRMYSMVMFLSVASISLWYAAYRYALSEKANIWKWGLLAVLTGGVSALAVLTHAILLLAVPGFVLFCAIDYVRTYTDRTMSAMHKHRIHVWFFCIVLLALGAIWAAVAKGRYHFFDLVGLGGQLNQTYELLPFQDLPIAFLGLAAYVLGCWYFVRSRSHTHRYVAVMSITVIGILAYITHRYHAYRYIVFMVPFIFAIAGSVIYRLLQTLAQPIRVATIRTIVTAAAFILLVVPLAWPGVEASALFTQAEADKTHRNGFGHDFATAYAYIQEYKQPGDALLSIDARSYYWGKSTDSILSLGQDSSLTLKQFEAIVAAHPHGWIFWANGKAHHLRKKVLAAIEERATNVSDQNEVLKKANFTVYQY